MALSQKDRTFATKGRFSSARTYNTSRKPARYGVRALMVNLWVWNFPQAKLFIQQQTFANKNWGIEQGRVKPYTGTRLFHKIESIPHSILERFNRASAHPYSSSSSHAAQPTMRLVSVLSLVRPAAFDPAILPKALFNRLVQARPDFSRRRAACLNRTRVKHIVFPAKMYVPNRHFRAAEGAEGERHTRGTEQAKRTFVRVR